MRRAGRPLRAAGMQSCEESTFSMPVSAWESRREKAEDGVKGMKLGHSCRSLLIFIFIHYKARSG